jgi:hypothetical protein
MARNYFLWAFAILVTVACSSASDRRNLDTSEDKQGWKGYQVFVTLSLKKGQVGKRFKAQIAYRPTRNRPDYIKEPMFIVKDLPPLLSFDSKTGIISGFPADPGEFSIRVGVRDKNRGTHSGRNWYLETFYLKIKKFNDLK